MNENKESNEINQAVMKTLRRQNWVGRMLVMVALVFGMLSILASIAIIWSTVIMIQPMEHLLWQDYPKSVQESGTNAEGKPPLSRDELDWRHVQVTVAHGKVAALTALSITLSGAGVVVMLGLVVFNRRVTLRHINASLTEISRQIKELQERGAK